ncbi:MAG: hypothetical protein QN720_05130 [Nitrososphaeraceae archaeon]|nr:hypothetical protein [Nitrososphaeraceae archaeon]
MAPATVMPGISQVAVYEITQRKIGLCTGSDAKSLNADDDGGAFTDRIS